MLDKLGLKVSSYVAHVQMFSDLILERLLREYILVAPILVMIGITEQLVTMGAEDFRVNVQAR